MSRIVVPYFLLFGLAASCGGSPHADAPEQGDLLPVLESGPAADLLGNLRVRAEARLRLSERLISEHAAAESCYRLASRLTATAQMLDAEGADELAARCLRAVDRLMEVEAGPALASFAARLAKEVRWIRDRTPEIASVGMDAPGGAVTESAPVDMGPAILARRARRFLDASRRSLALRKFEETERYANAAIESLRRLGSSPLASQGSEAHLLASEALLGRGEALEAFRTARQVATSAHVADHMARRATDLMVRSVLATTKLPDARAQRQLASGLAIKNPAWGRELLGLLEVRVQCLEARDSRDPAAIVLGPEPLPLVRHGVHRGLNELVQDMLNDERLDSAREFLDRALVLADDPEGAGRLPDCLATYRVASEVAARSGNLVGARDHCREISRRAAGSLNETVRALAREADVRRSVLLDPTIRRAESWRFGGPFERAAHLFGTLAERRVQATVEECLALDSLAREVVAREEGLDSFCARLCLLCWEAALQGLSAAQELDRAVVLFEEVQPSLKRCQLLLHPAHSALLRHATVQAALRSMRFPAQLTAAEEQLREVLTGDIEVAGVWAGIVADDAERLLESGSPSEAVARLLDAQEVLLGAQSIGWRGIWKAFDSKAERLLLNDPQAEMELRRHELNARGFARLASESPRDSGAAETFWWLGNPRWLTSRSLAELYDSKFEVIYAAAVSKVLEGRACHPRWRDCLARIYYMQTYRGDAKEGEPRLRALELAQRQLDQIHPADQGTPRFMFRAQQVSEPLVEAYAREGRHAEAWRTARGLLEHRRRRRSREVKRGPSNAVKFRDTLPSAARRAARAGEVWMAERLLAEYEREWAKLEDVPADEHAIDRYRARRDVLMALREAGALRRDVQHLMRTLEWARRRTKEGTQALAFTAFLASWAREVFRATHDPGASAGPHYAWSAMIALLHTTAEHEWSSDEDKNLKSLGWACHDLAKDEVFGHRTRDLLEACLRVMEIPGAQHGGYRWTLADMLWPYYNVRTEPDAVSAMVQRLVAATKEALASAGPTQRQSWAARLAQSEMMSGAARILTGQFVPESPVDHLEAGYGMYWLRQYDAAVRHYEVALESDELSHDLKRANLYNAACSASLAGAEAEEAEAAKALYEKAFAWLRADLQLRVRAVEGEAESETPRARIELVQHLKWAKADKDFAPLRGSRFDSLLEEFD